VTPRTRVHTRTRTQRGYGTAWDKLVAEARRAYPPVCRLCHHPIDLPARGRWAWSLDHLDPIARHGTATPTLDRVRPAHLPRKVRPPTGHAASGPTPPLTLRLFGRADRI